MKKAVLVAAVLLSNVLLFQSVSMIYAQWSALSSGYAVTTNWHGIDVPIGSSVTVWAGTTDSKVKTVQFKWKYPNETLAWDVTVPVFGPYVTPEVPPGAPQEIIEWANKYKDKRIKVWYATSTQMPLVLGDWGVQAIFLGEGGSGKGQGICKIAIRATSFFVVSEPATIVTLLCMSGAFSLVIKRKKTHLQTQR